MTPSTRVEILPEPKLKPAPHVETLVLEPPKPSEPTRQSAVIARNRIEEGSFQSSMIEFNRMKGSSRTLDILISLFLNLAVLSGPVLAGLYVTDTLNLKQYAATFLVAPPPPPPPPPAPAAMAVKAPPVHRVFENSGKLLAPTVIPRNVAEIKEAPLPSDADGMDGALGGVPGGVAGGTMGGVLGGDSGGVRTTAAAPIAPKELRSKAPVRVGGHVRAPQIIRRVEPTYPPLARQTRLQGVVVIDAVLDETGNVVAMKVVSGHPLLIDAALNAVRQWKYQPTYLNDEPTAVQMNITVTFSLSQ